MSLTLPLVNVKKIHFGDLVQERIHHVFSGEYSYHFLNKYSPQEYDVDGTILKDELELASWSGDTKRDGTRLWNDELTRLIWISCCEEFGINPFSFVERCYLNAQTKGQVSYWHPDSGFENTPKFTILYYPSINNRQEHRGTEFLVDGKVEYIPYHTGSAVMFRTDLWHRGLDTDSTLSPRNTLVFHTIDLTKTGRKLFEGTLGYNYD